MWISQLAAIFLSIENISIQDQIPFTISLIIGMGNSTNAIAKKKTLPADFSARCLRKTSRIKKVLK